jgi:hypothetical protein
MIFELFLVHLASKFSKSADMTKHKFFLHKNKKRYKKMQNFTLISNSLKTFLQNAPEKSYKQNKFDKHKLK